jgi:hypothetical protein
MCIAESLLRENCHITVIGVWGRRQKGDEPELHPHLLNRSQEMMPKIDKLKGSNLYISIKKNLNFREFSKLRGQYMMHKWIN